MKLVSQIFLCLILQSCVTTYESSTRDEPTPDVEKKMTPTPAKRSYFTPRPQNKAVKLLVRKSTSYLESGHLEKAVSSLERAYRIDYLDPQVSFLMAKVLYAKGKDSQSEQWALKSLSLWHASQSHQKRKAWELVSQCRLRRGDYEGANKAIERARSI